MFVKVSMVNEITIEKIKFLRVLEKAVKLHSTYLKIGSIKDLEYADFQIQLLQ